MELEQEDYQLSKMEEEQAGDDDPIFGSME
jgi:hypothetical protein